MISKEYIVTVWHTVENKEHFFFHSAGEAFKKVGELLTEDSSFTVHETNMLIDES